MTAVAPVPLGAEFFLDARGDARSLRVRWHHDDGLVVLSLWRGGECTGTFRLHIDEVPTLIEALRSGLDAAYDEVLGGRAASDQHPGGRAASDQHPGGRAASAASDQSRPHQRRPPV